VPAGPTPERGGVKDAEESQMSEETGWWEQYWGWILQGVKKEDLEEQEPYLLRQSERGPN